jgi:hypothetical protein
VRRERRPRDRSKLNFGELRLGEVRSIQLLGTRANDGAAPTQTQPHRSDGQCHRIRLRHLLYPATTCSTPMPGRRLWASLLLPYCCQAFDHPTGPPIFLWDLQEKQRADERTRTAFLIQLRVCCRTCEPVLIHAAFWLIYAVIALWQQSLSATFCFVPAPLRYGCGKLQLVTILRPYRVHHPSEVPNVSS